MSKNLKLSLALVAAAFAVLLGFAVFSGDDDGDQAASGTERALLLVRPDSQRLSAGTTATFVEYLDFECESCGAIYPTIERLKADYGDKVAFVIRYMPLHVSSVNAARAAEAAGEQGKFEAMYDVLFQRQADWGHKEQPEEAKFFGYAAELGLDMKRFRAAYDDPATSRKIERDKADGRALGVTGTPTMFLDGVRLQPKSLDDLVAAFDAAVRR